MPIYSVHFRTDNAYAIREIEAVSPKIALERAREIVRDEEQDLPFESYCETLPVNEIVIFDDAGEAAAVWCDEDLHLRFRPRQLLNAAREVVARWERGDLAEAVRALAAAIAKVEGRGA